MMYRVFRLTTWDGDHFNESFDYRLVGYTEDPELIRYLRSLTVDANLVAKSYWPLNMMNGYKIFKIVPCNILDKTSVDKLIEDIDTEKRYR